MKNDFVKRGREEMHDFVIKAIEDLLQKLDSPINLPIDMNGFEKENKLYAVVQSREEVYKSICDLMDLIKVEESGDQVFKNKIICGLKTTWHEMTKITTRDIGSVDKLNSDEIIKEYLTAGETSEMTPEEQKKEASNRVTDDIMTSIAKAKFLASKISYQILDRIEMLENPDAVNEQKLNNTITSNIIERFTEN